MDKVAASVGCVLQSIIIPANGFYRLEYILRFPVKLCSILRSSTSPDCLQQILIIPCVDLFNCQHPRNMLFTLKPSRKLALSTLFI